jgi:ABC-2 type transport system permease protein
MRFLILFFLKNAFRSRRVMLTAALALVPVLLAFALQLVPYITGGEIEPSDLFLQMGLLLHIYILLPLVAALIGSGAIADEVEERTLPYILTRPVPKLHFVLSKIISGFIVTGMILAVSLWVTYAVLVGPSGVGMQGLLTLLRVTGVLLIGSLVYVALFALLGAAVRRPVLYGLIFAFGWEKIVAHLPMRLKYFTVVKYLNDLYPTYRGEGTGLEDVLDETLKQFFRGGGVSITMSILSLLLIAICCAGLTTLLLYLREYRLEQE